MSNKIVFVNGKSKCGCVMAFSDGGGEYSDVHTIIPCAEHSMPESALTQRDDMRQVREQLAAAERRIAELEARTVNLPKLSVGEVMRMSGFSRDYAEGWCAGNDNAIHEIRTAGIKVKES